MASPCEGLGSARVGRRGFAENVRPVVEDINDFFALIAACGPKTGLGKRLIHYQILVLVLYTDSVIVGVAGDLVHTLWTRDFN
jgi:hypothetical protein